VSICLTNISSIRLTVTLINEEKVRENKTLYFLGFFNPILYKSGKLDEIINNAIVIIINTFETDLTTEIFMSKTIFTESNSI